MNERLFSSLLCYREKVRELIFILVFNISYVDDLYDRVGVNKN